MDYTELGKILQNARVALGLKQADIADKIGCTPANISSWERGKSKIDIDSFSNLCGIYNLDFAKTLDELSGGEKCNSISHGEIAYIKKLRALDKHGKKAVLAVLDVEYERCTKVQEEQPVIRLPKSLLRASAGTGNRLDGDYTEWITVPKTAAAEQANIVIEVAGDSMEPLFDDGDNVFVRIQPNIDVGEIGIFIVDGDGYIKKKGEGELISLNPAYPPIRFTEFSDCRCFGKVIGKLEN